MRIVKRMSLIILLFGCVINLISCKKKVVQDTSPLTMYVGLGNTGEAYCEKFHQLVLDNTGVDIQFVFSNTADTTNSVINMIQNNDLPADITVTSSATPENLQTEAFLDLTKYSNITDSFKAAKVAECSINGSVYQLPFTSRLIGIEYNKTLFEEMKWEVPNSYDDMLELKQKAEDAGYVFAVTAGDATGHGFNYLFHLMGTDYICTPKGSQWFKDFQKGNVDSTDFKDQSEYFKKYVESGLFGEFHSNDRNAKTEYSKVRALFYYNILNDVYSYEGFRYNLDGTLYGVTYNNSQPEHYLDDNGNAVMVNDEFVYYDENNPKHQELDRYTIPGAVVLNDTYGSMPWISENGSSNCYTMYDCMYIALDKKLENEDQENKRNQAIKVLEYMTTDVCADLFSSLYNDGFVSTTSFEIKSNQIYYEYKDLINHGNVIPWYYTYFDNDSINYVGKTINNYIKDNSSTFDDIFSELELRNQNHLNGNVEALATITEDLDYQDSAKLLAIANALSVQDKIGSLPSNNEVKVSLIPYVNNIKEVPLYFSLGLVQSKFYHGELKESTLNVYVNKNFRSPSVYLLTGKEIKDIVNKGFNPTTPNKKSYHFSYMMVTKNNISLNDNDNYVVAVADACLDKSILDSIASKKISDATGNTNDGLIIYTNNNKTISKDNIKWN